MADFTSPEATATRAALQAYPFLEGMVPYPSGTPNTPISPEDFIRGKMSPYGIEPTFQGDLTKLFRGENLLNNRGVETYWGLDPGTSNFFALPNLDPDIAPHTSATSYTGVIPTSEAARAVNVIPAMPGLSDVPTISQITVSPESSELIKSGRGASATAEALSENVKALEAGIPGTGTDPNPFLKAGRGFLKTLGRVTPWANVAGGALASYDYGQKDQNVREGLAALSTVPYLGTIPFAAETAINVGERLLGDPAMAADVAMPGSTYVPDPNYDAQAIQSELIQQGTTSSGSDQATPMFQQGTESLLPTNYDASSVSDEEMDLVYPEAIKYSFSDDEDLRDKILSDKWSQAITRFTPFTKNTSAFDDKVMRDLKIPDRTTGQERSINKKEYDALIHLAGTSRQGSDIAVRLYEEVFPDTDPWEAMKDAINNEVGRSYQGTDASLKEMLLDPRTVTDVSDIRGVGRSMLSGTPGVGADPVTSQEVRDTEAQEKSDERNRQAAVKSAEKEASAERAAKERAERAKEAARTERDRARAEQDRLAALSRQRAAEEKARKAAQSAAQKAEADRKKRAQQSASAAALASARMESLRQVELMRKRQEEKLLQDKLADQMARYQTTGRWVGGL